MKKVLTIAGSDCSGGAGIQADLKTMAAHGVYGMSAITALTAQNTTGVYGILEADGDFVANQLDCVFTDIFPDAVKIGMVSNSDIIVVDTVMVSTSGSKLLSDEAIDTVKNVLIPAADLITPNIPEAEVLSGIKIKNGDDMIKAAEIISCFYDGAILVKGGHLVNTANDLLFTNGKGVWFESERVDNDNTHGTGCTLSSAIACNLAMGFSFEKSVENAKEYITGALKANLNLGKGSGPLNHMWKFV